MAEDYAHTAKFRGARFTESDLNGATFRDCDLRNVKITSCAVDDMRISGFDGRAGTVTVDDVVVTDFVVAELDRRHPERVQLREVRTADDYRVMWATLERLWSDTLARAESLPEDARHERVDGEWSFVETLRHLVFAIDSWVGRVVLGEPAPYHRLALPHTDFPAEAPAQIGIEVDASPSYAEVVAVHAARRDRVRALLEAVTDGELGQIRSGTLTPGWDEESFPVGECLRVVLREHGDLLAALFTVDGRGTSSQHNERAPSPRRVEATQPQPQAHERPPSPARGTTAFMAE